MLPLAVFGEAIDHRQTREMLLADCGKGTVQKMVDSDRLVVDSANAGFVLGEKAPSIKWSTLVDSFWSHFC